MIETNDIQIILYGENGFECHVALTENTFSRYHAMGMNPENMARKISFYHTDNTRTFMSPDIWATGNYIYSVLVVILDPRNIKLCLSQRNLKPERKVCT